MPEIVVSEKGHIGQKGTYSALRHAGTGFLAVAVPNIIVEVIGFIGPAMDALKNGDWTQVMDLNPMTLLGVSVHGLYGAIVAGLYRLWQRRGSELKVEIPPSAAVTP